MAVVMRFQTQMQLPAKIIYNAHNKPPIRHNKRPPTPPIYISTNISDINTTALRDLYSSCNHSCHRFPSLLSDGRSVEPVDVDKLRIAVVNSSVVVSVFTRPEIAANLNSSGGEWYKKMIPLNADSGQLVGFGRAVSDHGFTASIYDLMVIPSLQRRGIGRIILQRIIRLLTNKGIYDIAALCSNQEMGFFKACGFGDDILGSTTMMYTRSGNDMATSAGRKLLMVPPLRNR